MLTGGMTASERSTDGAKAGSWGRVDKHYGRKGIQLQHDSQHEGCVYTHLDGTNPLRLLGGTECSPFSPYFWVITGRRIAQAYCRPNNDQSGRKDCGEKHRCAGIQRGPGGEGEH